MERKIVHIVGTGTIGEPLIGILCDQKSNLGIDEVTFHKQSPLTKDAPKIKNLIAKPEMGKVYKGKVVKIMEFGAFVNFLGKQDGLVHISELADKRVAKVGDVVKEGDEVSVKVVGFDRGKVKLSMKQAGS